MSRGTVFVGFFQLLQGFWVFLFSGGLYPWGFGVQRHGFTEMVRRCMFSEDRCGHGWDMGPKIWHDCNIEVEAIQRNGVKLEGIFG